MQSSLLINKPFAGVSKAEAAADGVGFEEAVRRLREQLAGGCADTELLSKISANGGLRPVHCVLRVPEGDENIAHPPGGSPGAARRETPACLGTAGLKREPEAQGSFENGNGAAEAVGSSLNNDKPWFNVAGSVGGAAVSEQWYHLNPQLAEAEIKAMHAVAPQAGLGFLPDGHMYWTIHLRPVIVGKRRDWTLFAVYDRNFPSPGIYGGACRFYPVKPNIAEMQEMVNRSEASPKVIPHLLPDADNQLYLCTQHASHIHYGQKKGERVTTAAAGLRFAMRWITVFELGLIDPQTWALFQDHGKI